jgi:branched-chain amino acid transport system ATP-binding protein
MLSLRGVRAGYGGGQVLHGIDLDVPAGTVTAIVGPNGAGKTTLVHTIAGLVPLTGGTIRLAETNLSGRSPHRVAQAGVGLVPQGRRVFASLTVAEHFALARPGRGRRSAGWDVPRTLRLLPRLGERLRHRGDQLSGGEQQMLAIARALLGQPRLLLLDEPCEGLAPNLAARIRALVGELAGAGMSVLLVEQGLDIVLDVADRIAVLDHGRFAIVDRHLGRTSKAALVDSAAATIRADPGAAVAVLRR